MIERAEVHDQDYLVFGSINSLSGTVLDIGANWGYSVGSFRAAGCTLPIVSLEISPQFRDCLEAVKKKLGGNYDYEICGAGAERGEFDLYIPVLNGRALNALSSGVPIQFNKWVVRNVVAFAREYLAELEVFQPQLQVMSVDVDTVDNIISGPKFDVPVDVIVAMKIDVEGAEGAVLQGSVRTLQFCKPLLLIEGAARSESVRRELLRHGYVGAVRKHEILELTASLDVETVNGFFVHPEQIEAYVKAGLLSQPVHSR
ncbi:FkbM family methyltransferase [Aestuariivirga sp.]|uniref:FkbM family methyltransferase n=1 Tax=Aestuariivirga sp. TaxID=2650926 RepID=UPI0039E53A32